MRLQSSLVIAARIAFAIGIAGTGALVAQDGTQQNVAEPAPLQRERLRGSLRDAGGNAIEGANIEAWYAPVAAEAVLFGIEDVVTTKTDARGRFELSLLRGAVYSIVGYWKDAEGVARQSVVTTSTGDRLVTLEPAEELTSGAEVDVVVSGDRAAYGILGQLRATVFCDGANWRRFATKPIDGDEPVRFEVPFTGDRGRVKIVVEDDRGPIHVNTMFLRKQTKVWQSRVNLPKGPKVDVHVTDKDGKAIAGAQIQCPQSVWGSSPWRTHAVTDDEGHASITTIEEFDKQWTIRVRAPGYVEAYGFRSSGQGHLCGKPCTEWAADKPIVFTLEAGEPLVGTVLDENGKGLPGIPVAMSYDVSLMVQPNSYRGLGSTAMLATTDEEGKYRFGGVGKPDSLRLMAALPPEILARLSKNSDVVPASWIELDASRAGSKSEVPTLDFSKAAIRVFSIRKPGGTPARGAAIVSLTDHSDSVKEAIERAPRADKRGRVALFVFAEPKSNPLINLFKRSSARSEFAILEGEGWKELRSSDLATEPGKEDEPIPLELEPFTERNVLVVDGDGQPLAGVTSNIGGSSWSGSGAMIDFARAANAIGLAQKSDDQGRMRLWSIDVPNMQHRISFHAQSKTNRNQVTLQLPSPGEEWTVTIAK
ncbi:MAG: carboxypeptidase regulatory-like domain-containing protein [Planctomycetes bacterium]|nr:carboxypeptidase regulatory-like domain-containing protein [Planctomycetota bacterium]MCB9919033.1 carboxypeptidase regulatory-like domain-containing protein [Planctomycetota bacterium]